MSLQEVITNKTIDKTIITARLFPGFWDRWIAHGMEKGVANQFIQEVTNLQEWIQFFDKHGSNQFKTAERAKRNDDLKEAKWHFRLSALYFNLSHWIFPTPSDEKRKWYQKSLNAFSHADELLVKKPLKEKVMVEEVACHGRIRIPYRSKGSVIIVNPIDSTKEELFSYEQHFVDLGFATFTFDGPGQGETFTLNGLRATKERWQTFMDKVITLANKIIPNNKIYLFGTSSGAMWSIKASEHPKVSKAVAVSPAVSKDIAFPEYFIERSNNLLNETETILPVINPTKLSKPIYLFHGKQDVMVKDSDIYQLYNSLTNKSKIKQYPNEGHCCNFKLAEIRSIVSEWFKE
ncbi:alpha/beta hydrolase [Gracilibacillus lacisalsi]|uniref:alpha/beta hydrolase n=1 Tax=Gracilibacillus lacisalsi TaxID=393087 RepID=UPI0003647388|nr:alpha/beta hydrolase [Gracilibacillus lacisalsi]